MNTHNKTVHDTQVSQCQENGTEISGLWWRIEEAQKGVLLCIHYCTGKSDATTSAEYLTVNKSYHTRKGQQLLTVFINMLYILAMCYL